MEKTNYKAKRCVLCLKYCSNITKEHVFPSSWYTDSTPGWVQRWTVPTCKSCNGKFGKMEQRLLMRLGLCTDPNKAEASGIAKKALRSFGGGIDNLSSKEAKIRKKLFQEVLRDLKPYNKDLKVFPGFGLYSGFPLETQLTIPIPLELIPVLEKIFRGAEYKLENQRYIEHSYKLKVYHVHEEPREVANLFEKFGKKTYLGPGFRIERASVQDKHVKTVLYKATTWGVLISYASIMKD